MTDDIDPEILKAAAQKCMERYPYFAVELVHKDGEYTLVHNSRPVVVSDEWKNTVLCSEMTNHHFTAFSYHGKWLNIDISHAITDGAGIYNLTKTLLYYYCTAKYDADIPTEGIMLAGDEIAQEEWEDPALRFSDIVPDSPPEMDEALSLFKETGSKAPAHHMIYSISADEKEFIDFVKSIDGTPATVVSALLYRAIASCHPDTKKAIRTVLTVNMRKALKAPLAHHPLVGGVMLTCDDLTGQLSLKEQVKMYRKAVAEQTKDDIVIAAAAEQRSFSKYLMSRKTDEERAALATEHAIQTDSGATAAVSYTGKASFGQIEKYIEECRELTNSIYMTPLLELAAMGDRLSIDFIQPFEDERYVTAFAKELDKCGVRYSMRPGERMILPKIELPWSK
jgi:hypothetical protein